MATTVFCSTCGEQVVRAPGPEARCPRCRAALPPAPPPIRPPAPPVKPTVPTVRPPTPPAGSVRPAEAKPVDAGAAARWAQTEIPASHFPVPADGYEDLELGPEPDDARPAPAVRARPSSPGISPAVAPPAAAPPYNAPPATAQAPAQAQARAQAQAQAAAEDLHSRRPPLSQSAIAASRMAAAPHFSSARKSAGLPIIPLGIGVVAIIAITVFALTRGGPAPVAAKPAPSEAKATETARATEPAPQPPAPSAPAAAEPTESAAAEHPAEAQPPREKRAEREPRPAKVERAAPNREQARKEAALAAATHPAAAPTPAPASPPPAPTAAAAAAAEPQAAPAPLFTPAQQEQTPSTAPLQLGPTYAREGMKKAHMADPSCLGNNLRLPRDLSLEGESATVKFAVDEKGAVSRYEYLSGPTDSRVSTAIWNAIQRCDFVPGATAAGQPIQLWITMPVRFGR